MTHPISAYQSIKPVSLAITSEKVKRTRNSSAKVSTTIKHCKSKSPSAYDFCQIACEKSPFRSHINHRKPHKLTKENENSRKLSESPSRKSAKNHETDLSAFIMKKSRSR